MHDLAKAWEICMKTRITEILGIEYPVIQGGMAWVAEYHLASAVSEAGGLGEHAINMSTIVTNPKKNNTIRMSRFCDTVFIRKLLFEIRCKGTTFF